MVLLTACAGAPLDQVHDALDAVADVGDPAYEATVVACLATERLALARAGDNEAAWIAARDRIRPVCDRAVEAWEAAATAHATSREAVDACAAAPDATCIAKALRAAKDAKAAIDDARTAWSAAKLELERITSPEPTSAPAIDPNARGPPDALRELDSGTGDDGGPNS